MDFLTTSFLSATGSDTGFKKTFIKYWPGNQATNCFFCPLQTIVLGDLVGCGSPPQIAKGLVFFKAAKWPLYVVCSGLPHLTQQVKF